MVSSQIDCGYIAKGEGSLEVEIERGQKRNGVGYSKQNTGVLI